MFRNSSRTITHGVAYCSLVDEKMLHVSDKLNSHFRKSYAVRHEEQIEISAVGKTAKFAFSKPRSVANSEINRKDCSDDAGDFRNGFPSLELT